MRDGWLGQEVLEDGWWLRRAGTVVVGVGEVVVVASGTFVVADGTVVVVGRLEQDGSVEAAGDCRAADGGSELVPVLVGGVGWLLPVAAG